MSSDSESIDFATTLVRSFVTAQLGEAKATVWMEAKNPMLGGQTPRHMIEVGRTKKLLKLIRTSLMENQRSE